MICHSQTFRINVRGNAAGHWVTRTGLKVKEDGETAAAVITLTRAGLFYWVTSIRQRVVLHRFSDRAHFPEGESKIL
jgi:hypothetical protein